MNKSNTFHPPEDHSEWRGCKNKNRYVSRKHANKGKRTYEGRYGEKFSVYKCRYCDGYHLCTKKNFQQREK